MPSCYAHQRRTRWNRFTGSHPINDGDPQNDDLGEDEDEPEREEDDCCFPPLDHENYES